MTSVAAAPPLRLVAVVVLNWNGGEDTLRAVRSVSEADWPVPCRVYVPDNGSTDGSPARVRAAFPDVALVENGRNLGYAGGNNRGWRAAAADGADAVLFLNNDAVLAPDAPRALLAALEAPGVGAVSPRIFRGGGPEDGEGDVWFEKGRVSLDSFVVAAHESASDGERAEPVCYESEMACGCALLVRTATLEAVGGFDESFFAYYEDVDLSLKVRARGLRCAVAAPARAWHRESSSTGGPLSPVAAFYVFRNGRYLARRHAPTADAWRAYRRAFLRGWLSQVKWLTRTGAFGAASGGAALQGGVCALLGQTGPRPGRLLPDAPFRWAAARVAGLPTRGRGA